MVNTQKLVIGYILTFLGIYLGSFVVSMNINVYSNSTKDLLGTNDITTAYSTTLSSTSGLVVICVAVVVLISFGILSTFGSFSG